MWEPRRKKRESNENASRAMLARELKNKLCRAEWWRFSVQFFLSFIWCIVLFRNSSWCFVCVCVRMRRHLTNQHTKSSTYSMLLDLKSLNHPSTTYKANKRNTKAMRKYIYLWGELKKQAAQRKHVCVLFGNKNNRQKNQSQKCFRFDMSFFFFLLLVGLRFVSPVPRAVH